MCVCVCVCRCVCINECMVGVYMCVCFVRYFSIEPYACAFLARWADYVSRGVRWVWRGEGAGINNTFSQDLEPEYVTLDDAETKAYVALQVSQK